jgi:putative nucleotidyltransferase with HDIG domain
MRRILFVDDDPSTVQELKTMLRPMSHEWEMEFAVNGEEALGFMAKFPFDVIVSDMHMPGISGVELLDTVKKRYSRTVRIIHSEHSDKEMLLRSVKSAHQFLMKPCNAETMKYTIERACKLRDLLKNETLKEIITGINKLPSLPRLYNSIVAELYSKNASLKKVGHIISQDVSMSAKILQLVNTAFFGLPQKITDPYQAVVYLGIDTVKALVLSIHVFSSFTEDAESCGFSLAEMWRHSLRTSKLARNIAHAEMADGKVVEEATIAGMLHDIGKLVLLKVPVLYKEITELVKMTGCDLVEAEYIVIKTSHAELGAYLLGLWGIPDNVVEAVAFHHNPSKLLEDMVIMSNKTPGEVSGKAKGFTALTAVHMANALMMQESSSPGTTEFPYVDMQYLSQLNLMDKLPEWVECYNEVIREDI